MELFNEHKNKYFSITEKIINSDTGGGYNESQIKNFLKINGFNETDFEFEAALLNKSRESNYYILKKYGGLYKPVIKSKIPVRTTLIEKQWLKMVLEDERASLFISDSTKHKLQKKLNDTSDTLKKEYWDMKNQDSLGDDFTTEQYKANFSLILHAAKYKKKIRYTYIDNKGLKHENSKAYVFRMEYSLKNNRFRLSVLPEDSERPVKMNLSRLQHVEILDEEKVDLKDIVLKKITEKKAENPIVLELSNKWNSIERCFSLFSFYEKEAFFDAASNKHKLKIYYYAFEESEIIRDILSLGSSVVVLEPEHVRAEIIRRITLQTRI